MDKTSLQTLVYNAYSVRVTVSENGVGLAVGTPYTTQKAWDDFYSAISYAERIISNSNSSQYDVSSAVDYLNNAISNYRGQYQSAY